MAEGQIVVELILDDGQIIKALGRVKQEANELKDDLENDKGGGFFGKKLGDLTVGFAAMAYAAKKAFDIISEGFGHAVTEAREGQKAIDDLSASFLISGKGAAGAVDKFTEFAESLSKQTGINDDLIVQNASLLQSLGQLSEQGLERASKAALNLSAATGKDTTTAFQLLGQAAEGSTGAFKKLGLKFDEAAPKGERFNQILSAIEKKFGELAALRAEGFEGTLNKITNAGNEIFKIFGNLIVQSPVVQSILKTISGLIVQFGDFLKKSFQGQDPIGDLIKKMIPFVEFVGRYLIPPIELFTRAFITGFLAIGTAWLALQTLFAEGSKFIIQNVMGPIVDFFASAIPAITAIVDEELADKLQQKMLGFKSWMTGFSSEVAAGTGELFKASLDALLASADSTFNQEASDKIQAIVDKIKAGLSEIAVLKSEVKTVPEELDAWGNNLYTFADSFSQVMEGMKMAAQDMAANISQKFREVGKTMFTTLGTGLGNAFAAMGKAMVKGENALQAFLNTMLAAMGQAMVQLGTMYILLGIAKTWAYDPAGPPLIAAGAALAVFGGVLMAIGGGGGGGAEAGAGGFTGGGAIPGPTQELEDMENKKPETKIEVNIQGSVFDSTETGMRITEIIRESFDLNDTKLVVG